MVNLASTHAYLDEFFIASQEQIGNSTSLCHHVLHACANILIRLRVFPMVLGSRHRHDANSISTIWK